MYKVVAEFADMHDNGHIYRVGDTFPHSDMTVSPTRIKELLSTSNRRNMSLIAEVEEMQVEEKLVEDRASQDDEAPKPKRRGRKKESE